MISRNKLYLIILAACLAGYIWIGFNLMTSKEVHSSIGLCYFKFITHLPCPSCGNTRAIIALLQGNLYTSVLINPLGLLMLISMIVTPLWIFLDLLLRKNSLLSTYVKLESRLQKPLLYCPLIALVIINWIWNISKNL